MPELDSYRQWLASGSGNRALVETIQVKHPLWGDLFFANWDSDFGATISQGLATGASVTFASSRFYFEPATIEDGLEQATQLVVSSLGGILYGELKKMTNEDRRTPIQITYRLFFHDDGSTPLFEPAPVWTVHAIEANRESIKAELRSAPLRIQRIGEYYTKSQFPVLVYV